MLQKPSGSFTGIFYIKALLKCPCFSMNDYFLIYKNLPPFYIIVILHISFQSQYVYLHLRSLQRFQFLVWLLHIFDLNIKPFNNWRIKKIKALTNNPENWYSLWFWTWNKDMIFTATKCCYCIKLQDKYRHVCSIISNHIICT